MKKLLLGLGSIASVVAPLAAVISCGDDDKNTNAGTQAKTYTITGDALDQVKAGLTAALDIPDANVQTVITGDNFTSGSFHANHYTKVTFNKDTDIEADSTTTAHAGDSLIIGVNDAQRRTSAPVIKLYFLPSTTDGSVVGQELPVNSTKQGLLKTGVIDKVIEFVQSQQPSGGNGAGSTTGTTVTPSQAVMDPIDANKIHVSAMISGMGLTAVPTQLTEHEIAPVMNSIKALSNVATATTIEYTLGGINLSEPTNGTLQGLSFTITIAAGKAGNLADVVAAAHGVAGVPVTSGGTGGTGPIAVDLDAEAAKFVSPLQSTKNKRDIIAGLNKLPNMVSGSAFDDDADIVDRLGITLPNLATGVDVYYELEEAFNTTSTNVKVSATLSVAGSSKTKNIHIQIAPKASLTQATFDS